MKKIAIFGLVFILLAVSVAPVMAGNGSPNGHGNGVGNGQGNGGGNKDKDKERGQERSQDKEKNSEHGSGKFKNQENNKWKYTPFYLQGVITAVGADTVTVEVLHANAKIRAFVDIGETITIKVNESTLYHLVTQGEDKEGEDQEGDDEGDKDVKADFTFADLAVGQNVAIHGRLMDKDYTARLIKVTEGMPLDQPVEATP